MCVVSFILLVFTSFFLSIKFVGRMHLANSIALDLFCFIFFNCFLSFCFDDLVIRILNLTFIEQLIDLV